VNELERIVRAAGKDGEQLLATVVRVEGSSYRRPGARMLVAGDRWLAGCVSGGCLEGDVMLRGAHRCKDGPVVVTYDSTSDDGSEPYGLGCNGIVDVLLEHVSAGTQNDALAFAAQCFAAERVGVLATVIRSSRPDVPVGARCSLPEATFVRPLVDPALRAVVHGPAGVVEHGGVTLLVETIAPSPQLFIMGSGHDAAPLVPLVKSAGFRVTVSDRAIREPSRFLAADRLVKSGDVPALIDAALEAYVVIMHHHKDADRAALEMALASRARYIGVLGPASRTRELLGFTPDDPRVHAPIGLDIGAETPEQIALSIAGQVQAVHHGARGGMLRDRQRALHADVAIAVLAAGESKRLGRPKQLVEIAGTPLVAHVAARCLALRGGPVGIVIGANAGVVEHALGDLRVARIANGAWSEGIASSIRAAVTWAEASRANALVIVLGDQPMIDAAHLAALRDAWLAGAPIAASRYNGILGAPAIFDRAQWPRLAQLEGDQGAGKLLYDAPVAAIDWTGGAIDVDTPEDVTRVTSGPSPDPRVP
jgi:xanthine dehydrogenase accessory factor